METLYIIEKDTTLKLNGKKLEIISSINNKNTVLPINQLKNIVINKECMVSTDSLSKLSQAGITICCINNRHPDLSLHCYNPKHGNAFRRLAQYKLHSDNSQSLKIARSLIHHKLNNLSDYLKKESDQYPHERFILLKSARLIQRQIQSLQQAKDNSVILGIEGSATKLFYQAYQHLFSSAWEFNNRNRRPPKDPVNSIISLSATLVHHEAVRACIGLGLDTQLGALHQVNYNRDSLACDMIELLRPKLFAWIHTLFSNNTFTVGDFNMSGESCLLTKRGSKQFYIAYHSAAKVWRKELTTYATLYGKFLDHYYKSDAA